jgi:branched-chain amino acid transport system substrate-binding protein
MVAVSQWDANAGKWSLITDFVQSDQDILNPLIDEDAASFAAENNITPGCN